MILMYIVLGTASEYSGNLIEGFKINSLNSSKTKFIIFSNHQSNNKLKLMINNEEIDNN